MTKTAVAKTVAKRETPAGLDARFVLGTTLPLLVAALLVNLPLVHALGWPRSLFNCLVWLATLWVLRHDSELWGGSDVAAQSGTASRRRFAFLRGRPRSRGTMVAALSAIAVLSVLSFYDFGRFHGGGRFIHYHDLYHYYMGSKYFPEVGYEGLYAATHRALVENDPAIADSITLVKNLRTYDVENARISMQRSDGVANLFSGPRWEQFRNDVRFFQAAISPTGWQVVLVDHGFNATPFWRSVGAALSTRLPLNDATLTLLALLDPALMAMALLLVWRTFDAKTALLVAIFLFANSFGVFDITGGAFLRQLWLAALIGFVCCYRRGWMLPAAGLLAVAALDRVFPVVFLLPVLVLLALNKLRRQPARRPEMRFIAAFAACAVGLGLLACATTGGPRTWTEWYGKISAHNRWFYTNQLSLRNLFTVNPVQSVRTIATDWDEGLWLRERESLDAHTRNTLLATRALLLAGLIAVTVRRGESSACWPLLSFAPLVLFYPADYYCVFLSVTVLCWRANRPLALAMMGLQAFFWMANAALSGGLRIELLHWLVSLCLMLALVAFLARELADALRSVIQTRGTLGLSIAGGATAVMVLAVAADVHAAQADRFPRELDVTPRDISAAGGVTTHLEQMATWGNGWSRNDHLLCLAEGPGAHATLRVPVKAAGSYAVTVAYSTGPPFGIVTLAVNEKQTGAAMNLFAVRPGIVRVVYALELRAGENEFMFAVSGRDPAAKGHYFAVDTISIAAPAENQAGNQSRRAAAERAVAWITAHPADSFDGGRPAICAELSVLRTLASRPQFSASQPDYAGQVRQRLAEFGDRCGPRFRPAEYQDLLTAAYTARHLNLPFAAFDAVSGQLRSWVDALYRDRSVAQPLTAGEYFNRLYPAQPAACSRDQSVLYRERTERKLAQVLAGEVDRAKSRAVASTVFALSQDVCAVTDFGNAPPPADGFLADRRFWAKLCEDGLRWTMQTGDLVTLARLAHMGECLGLAQEVPSLPTALDFLVRHQAEDGSFGAVSADSANPYREAVTSAALALGLGLR